MNATTEREQHRQMIREEYAESRRMADWHAAYDAAKAAGANHADAWRAATARHGRPAR